MLIKKEKCKEQINKPTENLKNVYTSAKSKIGIFVMYQSVPKYKRVYTDTHFFRTYQQNQQQNRTIFLKGRL